MKYIKKYIPILFFLILLLPGCTVNKDIKKDSDVVTVNNPVSKITEPHLDLIEEIYDNMEYDKIILKYKEKVPSSATISRFRYYVIFSDLDENTTYNLIDKDIRNTSDEMTKNYVSRLPDSVTPVFLFKDYDTYENFSVNTIGLESDDLSPFGF
jgi:PBP1b-binding outer membrane lipoprotein LpoB